MGEGSRRSDQKRGKIKEFTYKSRNRLLKSVNKIRRTELPLFITLTYPDKWPDDPKEWKLHLKNFVERMGYNFDKTAIIWRLESQKRGAPHFHLLVWGLPARYAVGLTDFKVWMSKIWYEVVDSGDEKHLLAGTRVEKIRSRDGVVFYAAKYLSNIV